MALLNYYANSIAHWLQPLWTADGDASSALRQ
jgi:hypothetical protein